MKKWLVQQLKMALLRLEGRPKYLQHVKITNDLTNDLASTLAESLFELQHPDAWDATRSKMRLRCIEVLEKHITSMQLDVAKYTVDTSANTPITVGAHEAHIAVELPSLERKFVFRLGPPGSVEAV